MPVAEEVPPFPSPPTLLLLGEAVEDTLLWAFDELAELVLASLAPSHLRDPGTPPQTAHRLRLLAFHFICPLSDFSCFLIFSPMHADEALFGL